MITIGVMAPGRSLDPTASAAVEKIAAARFADAVRLVIHPQCYLSHGHFAGDDAARVAAFLDLANDPAIDAVWFARGGYGAGRVALAAAAHLAPAALRKTYLGYSDAGFLLAALDRAGAARVAHGPMPADIARTGGEAAVARALAWLSGDAAGIDAASAGDGPIAAFNMTVLSQMIGTPIAPRLAGRVLALEEVGEHLYRIDRTICHILNATPAMAGLRLGRCSDIPENDIAFGMTPQEIAAEWCARAGVPFLGAADIGHDAANAIIPFRR
jgi:muramoyltetrapeptide carboxypeptidase